MSPYGYSFDEPVSVAPGGAAIRLNFESYSVGPDFFQMYDIRLLKGRTFGPDDPAGRVVVGDRFASSLWPGVDPIGRSFTWGKETYEVVGMTREMNRPQLGRPEMADLYLPFAPGSSYQTVSIRCGNACPSEGLIRQRLQGAGPALQVAQVRRLEETYWQDLAQPRATAALGFAFAAIALLAAAGGLFSVLSYTVGRRRREFGIRKALGASPGAIRGIVLMEGVVVGVFGLSLGSIAVWPLARVLASLSYGVTASDPLSWAAVLAVLGLTTLAASWRPARTAMRIDPALLLRDE